MTPTLNITIQRPTDEEVAVLRSLADHPQWIVNRIRETLTERELIEVMGDMHWITRLGTLALAAYDAEAAGDGGQVEAKGTTRCPLCGYDEPHYAANHREDTPFRPEIDWAFESFEEAWMKVFAGPRVWSPNELDREAGGFAYKDEEVEAKWQIFRTGWLLARGRRDVLPDRD